MANIPQIESKLQTEIGFVKAHWTSLSLALIAVAVVMLFVGIYIGHKL